MKFSDLEKMDPDTSPEPDLSLRSKQTVQMLLRDLATVRKLADLFWKCILPIMFLLFKNFFSSLYMYQSM